MGYLNPGDTLHVMPGTYSSLLRITRSGKQGAPITVVGDPTTPTLIHTTTGNAIQLANGVSYVTIAHFDVQASDVNGVGIFTEGTVPVHHIVITRNRVHDCGAAGIAYIHGDYPSIMHNVVYNNAWTSPSDSSGIDLYQLTNTDQATGTHAYVADNIVYANANKVPPVPGTSTTDGNGIIVDDGRHTQNGYLATAPAFFGTTLIENNIVFNNGGNAIHVNKSDNVQIRNNTTYQDNTDPDFNGHGYGEIMVMNSGTVAVYNNILWSSGTAYAAYQSQNSTNDFTDYNVTYNVHQPSFYAVNSTGTFWGPHSVYGNPLFVNASTDPAKADFHILGGSAAFGAGMPGGGPAYDFDGVKRPSVADAGAYQ